MIVGYDSTKLFIHLRLFSKIVKSKVYRIFKLRNAYYIILKSLEFHQYKVGIIK